MNLKNIDMQLYSHVE